MKIAVPTRDNMVDNHFGHCDTYTIFDIDDHKNITSKEILKWSKGCGCKSNIVATLKDMGVQTLLAGNMGQGALNVLLSHGLEVIRGCQGNVEHLVLEYLNGNLEDQDILCDSHHHHH
jgi:predicted Fe-Mo cluster-binding NifX family protein